MSPSAIKRWPYFRLALKPLRDLLVFSGRSTRSEVVAFLVLNMLANAISFALRDWSATGPAWGANLAWQIFWSLPWIALFVRRLHDQSRSARWIALMAVEAGVGVIFLLSPGPALAAALKIAFTASMLTQLYLMLVPVTHGPNRYGPDPRTA